ncbi:hypothetical protein [Actinokineospora cianjurensis]|uniref:Extracellular solute-binding protein n=1 Tax=Actinokineospora cianjurensis TaxID=585224 RepID=A0A421B5N3_9PSEU|nr:hypothetical protein [Actinokineospora cianjurensis]RLK59792.1 hypothetical protein CLV68_0277 [Actinokineospora cianjurensis]
MKRRISIGLAVVLLAAVVVAIIFGSGDDDQVPGQGAQVVRGVGGSEKAAFFADARVVEVFGRHGLRVEFDSAGSRQIATTVDLGPYDFAFPSSRPAAQRIKQDKKVNKVYTPFRSPMAVATFAPIVDLLTAQGVVHKGLGEYQVLDIAKYLELTGKGTRWDQLPGNTAYPVRKNVLITTTDPRNSNSAAMYLALVSHVLNDNQVVATPEAEAKVLPPAVKLFIDQGYTQSSSEGPFEDYLAAGMGKAPLVFIYESQFLDRQLRGDGSIRPDMKLLYPQPTLLSEHTLVPLKGEGGRVGELLSTDPDLKRLAAEFGFRTDDPKAFLDLLADRKLNAPADLLSQAEVPSYETLERLLNEIAKYYR